MWYLAEILFAEVQQEGHSSCHCESCNVLFSADSAAEAHQKALRWGQRYAAEPPATMQLLGVSHLTTIGQELGDGVEVCGRFFEEPDVWSGAAQLVPPAEELEAIRWERGRDTPVGDLLNAEQIAQLKRRLGADD